MNYLQLLPKVLTLMAAAEELGGEGSGAEKKEAVKASVKAISSGMESASTGGQKVTWKQIDDTIDLLAGLF